MSTALPTLGVDQATVRSTSFGVPADKMEAASKASFWNVWDQVAAAAKEKPLDDQFVSILNNKRSEATKANAFTRFRETVVLYAKLFVEWLFPLQEVLAELQDPGKSIKNRVLNALLGNRPKDETEGASATS
jgi:hypothetical protein